MLCIRTKQKSTVCVSINEVDGLQTSFVYLLAREDWSQAHLRMAQASIIVFLFLQYQRLGATHSSSKSVRLFCAVNALLSGSFNLLSSLEKTFLTIDEDPP